MSTLKSRFTLFATLAVLISAWGCSSSNILTPTGTVTVSTAGGDFLTAQAAIDASPPGTTIEILGTVDGQVIVNKPVTLVGSGAGSTLRMQGAPLATPDESAATASSSAVVIIRDTSGVTISNMTLSGPEDGLQIRNSTDITVIGITATNNGDDGIDIRSSSAVTVSGGTFSGNGDVGVQVRDGSDDVLISDFTADSNVDRGVRIRESSDVSLLMANSTNNGDDGVLVRDMTGALVDGCTITGNMGEGLHIRNSPDTVEQNNTVTGNAGGDIVID